MDKNSIMSQAEKYRQEMMKLYGRSTNNIPSEPVKDEKEEMNIEENRTDSISESYETDEKSVIKETDEEKTEEVTEDNDIISEEITDSDIDLRYPDPVLDELRKNQNIEYNDEEYMLKNGYDSIGWISVDVRTGESSNPITNASVIISSIDEGKTVFKANSITNESGQVFKIPLPVPSATLSLDSENKLRPYAVYDISVYAPGFFRARSVDVPVFEGITSVQLFNLVPLPLYMKEDDEIITYYNQEPELQ